MKQIDEFDRADPRFMDFVLLFFKEKKYCFAITALSLTIAVTLAFVLPKKYAGITTFVSFSKVRGSDMSARGGEAAALSTVLAAATGGGTSSSNTFYLALVESSVVKDLIIDELDLVNHYKTLGAINKLDARGILQESVVAKDLKSGVIQLRVMDPNAEFAQKIANAYPEKINQFLNSISLTDAQRHAQFLKDRLVVIEKEIESTRLERQSNVKEALYMMLLKEYELARANAAKDRLDVQVIDRAETPMGPAFPRFDIFSIVGLGIGIVLSILFVVTREVWRHLMLDPRNAYLANRMASDLSMRRRLLSWKRLG